MSTDPKDVTRQVAARTHESLFRGKSVPRGAVGTSPGNANYAKNRLFYLVRSDSLFQEVQKITYRKTKTSFRVYYGRPNSGSIFDYREHRDGKVSLQFPALNGSEVEYVFSPELDDSLLKAFTLRATDAGVSADAPPKLRSIKGGQSSPAASKFGKIPTRRDRATIGVRAVRVGCGEDSGFSVTIA
jgi:hypothetical protein